MQDYSNKTKEELVDKVTYWQVEHRRLEEEIKSQKQNIARLVNFMLKQT